MKKVKKLSLTLNKQVIDQLDQVQMSQINGGEEFTTLWGSNCYNTDPLQHQCCTGTPDTAAACVSYTTVTDTTPGTCCNCTY